MFRALPLAVAIHGTWNYLSTTHEAWFGPFLTLLITAAVWATHVARTASPYRKAQAHWGAVVSRTLRVATAGAPASRTEFVHLVRTLQPMMMTLRRQPGSLQNEVYVLLSRAFRPDTPEAEADQSLARAIRFLQTHPAVVTDWGYVVLLGIVLLVLGAGTSTLCLFLMWGVR